MTIDSIAYDRRAFEAFARRLYQGGPVTFRAGKNKAGMAGVAVDFGDKDGGFYLLTPTVARQVAQALDSMIGKIGAEAIRRKLPAVAANLRNMANLAEGLAST